MASVTHLTLTGPHAGYPLCGCDKEQEAARGARFVHWQFTLWRPEQFAETPLCAACVAIRDDESEDDE